MFQKGLGEFNTFKTPYFFRSGIEKRPDHWELINEINFQFNTNFTNLVMSFQICILVKFLLKHGSLAGIVLL